MSNENIKSSLEAAARALSGVEFHSVDRQEIEPAGVICKINIKSLGGCATLYAHVYSADDIDVLDESGLKFDAADVCEALKIEFIDDESESSADGDSWSGRLIRQRVVEAVRARA